MIDLHAKHPAGMTDEVLLSTISIVKEFFMFSPNGAIFFQYPAETTIDPDLFGGFMSALAHFSEESIHERLSGWQSGADKFKIYQEDHFPLVIVVRFDQKMQENLVTQVMIDLYQRFYFQYKAQLLTFAGDVTPYKTFLEHLKQKIGDQIAHDRETMEDIIPDSQLLEILKNRKVSKLHEIQIDAIKQGLFFHQNFLVCTPSGSGKTLIAELAIANVLLKNLGTAMYLVPYKALATEKGEQFKAEYQGMDVGIDVVTSDTETEDDTFEKTQLLIATYEKCDAMLRQNHPYLQSVRCIIVDEIHEMATPHRGSRLEVLLINLLSQFGFIQCITLSATINNYQDYCNWLSSFGRPFKLIFSDKRPVALHYEFKLEKNKNKAIRSEIERVLSENGQILVFVNRRRDCATYARQYATIVKPYLSLSDAKRINDAKRELIAQHSIAKDLLDSMESGITPHNAALGPRERTIIEKLYREKVLKVIICTTTLAAGVNLPARTVIIPNTIQSFQYNEIEESAELLLAFNGNGYMRPIPSNLLFQICGRAGRPGLDAIGEAIFIAKDQKELQFIRSFYFKPQTNPDGSLIPQYMDMSSQLNYRRALQEMVLMQIFRRPRITIQTIERFLLSTYFGWTFTHQHDHQGLSNSSLSLVHFLLVDTMDLEVFLQLHGVFELIIPKPRYQFKLVSLRPDCVEGQVLVNESTFHCAISLGAGFRCSCLDSSIMMDDSTEGTVVFKQLCPHLTAMIYALRKTQSARVLKQLMAILAKHDYIINYLKRNGLIIEQDSDHSFGISQFGRLAMSLYLYPDELVSIREILENRRLTDPESLLYNVVQFYCMQHNHPFMVIHEIIAGWIAEHTVENILQTHPNLGVGDIFMYKSDLTRIVSIFSTIANLLGKYELLPLLKDLELRVQYGVKQELVPLCEYFANRITRNRARILFDHGFTNVNTILDTAATDIFKQTKIPLERLMDLRQEGAKPKKANSLLDFL